MSDPDAALSAGPERSVPEEAPTAHRSFKGRSAAVIICGMSGLPCNCISVATARTGPLFNPPMTMERDAQVPDAASQPRWTEP